MGREADGTWGYLRDTGSEGGFGTGAKGGLFTEALPDPVYICAISGSLPILAGPDPAAASVGTLPDQTEVVADSFALTTPSTPYDYQTGPFSVTGSGFLHISAPMDGWIDAGHTVSAREYALYREYTVAAGLAEATMSESDFQTKVCILFNAAPVS